MNLSGIHDLMAFLNYLVHNRIWYRLLHLRDDSIMVSIHLAGLRLEVDFFEEHIEYNIFEGDESVHDDQDNLFKLIGGQSM